ncbi:uncharacterized protein PV09_05127 [Verruconis gallopava]|uniref:Uncharacterized protein n=1 Tax=Verruconis gallopava TaxID=253628 RepID=A0A0D2AAM5_9PEZI|nr:uncharacterized protein PV09_05127 [Verruconis gallopava]KIW03828.1 hypothetical protein PV09_05127 [Verruconis gallopava]
MQDQAGAEHMRTVKLFFFLNWLLFLLSSSCILFSLISPAASHFECFFFIRMRRGQYSALTALQPLVQKGKSSNVNCTSFDIGQSWAPFMLALSGKFRSKNRANREGVKTSADDNGGCLLGMAA